MSVYSGPEISDSGLILHLDALNAKSFPGSGSTWFDLSGNANNFTMNGSLIYSSTNGFSGFTQTTRWYRNSTSWPSNLKTSQGGSGYTTLVWCKVRGTSGWQKIIGNGDEQGYIDLYIRSGTTQYYQEDGSSLFYNDNNSVANSAFSLTTNTWYLLGSTNSNSGTLTNPTDQFGIGAEGDAVYSYPFNGDIAVVSLYNRVLSSSEILNYYNAYRTRFSTPAEVKSGLTLNLDAGQSSSYPGSGTTWTNLGTVGGNYTLTNGPTYNSGSGGSIVFDGTDDNVTGTAPTYYTDYTISCAFKISAFTSAAGLVSWGTDSASQRRGLLYWNGGSGTNYRLISSTYASNIFGTTTLALNTWYYGTVSVSSTGAARVYLNGVLEGTGTNTLVSPASNTFKVGSSNSAGEFFNGNIAIVKVFNRVLTDLEVARDFDALRGRFGI